MAELHHYRAIDSSFFDTAPIRLDDRITVGHPRDVVWKVFEDNSAWAAFDTGIASATWTSTPPLHPGSTRHLQFAKWLGGGIVNEVFFDWNPHERFAFYLHEGTSKRIEAYGEQWSFKDLGGGCTEIRFRTAMSLAGRFMNPFVRFMSPILNLGYLRTLRAAKRYIEQHAAR